MSRSHCQIPDSFTSMVENGCEYLYSAHSRHLCQRQKQRLATITALEIAISVSDHLSIFLPIGKDCPKQPFSHLNLI